MSASGLDGRRPVCAAVSGGWFALVGLAASAGCRQDPGPPPGFQIAHPNPPNLEAGEDGARILVDGQESVDLVTVVAYVYAHDDDCVVTQLVVRSWDQYEPLGTAAAFTLVETGRAPGTHRTYEFDAEDVGVGLGECFDGLRQEEAKYPQDASFCVDGCERAISISGTTEFDEVVEGERNIYVRGHFASPAGVDFWFQGEGPLYCLLLTEDRCEPDAPGFRQLPGFAVEHYCGPDDCRDGEVIP